MKQFVIDHLLEQAQASDRFALVTPHAGETGGEADLLLRLKDGKTIALYIINRAIRIPEIRECYARNTKAGRATLFIVDGRMLPGPGQAIEPPGWMAALHTLAHGRIYAYWCERRTCQIRPLHMDWMWGEGERHVEYGDVVRVEMLRPTRISAATRAIDGDFTTADFGEGAFWKKRDPNENRQQKYSWRTWNFRPKAQPAQEAANPAGWDAWDDFQRHYGDAGESGFGDDAAFGRTTGSRANPGAAGTGSARARSGGRTRGEPRAYTVLTRHYATLGVQPSATLEEVKRAYRSKAREFHPDLHPERREQYTAKMAEINAAFEAISREKEQA
jgi:hypothetical protein